MPARPDPERLTILLYNFVQPGEGKGKQGGGVGVYQDNLLQELRARGHDVIFLSSGDAYSLVRRDPHVVFTDAGLKRAVVVNSPVFAPAHFTFHRIDLYNDSPALDDVPAQLRAKYGRIDVFHFQNVEGLTVRFFRALRETFPDSTILLSAHNYNLVCPQVNLWFRESKPCTDYRDGRACVNCLLMPDRHRYEGNIRRMNVLLDRLRVPRRGLTRDAMRWTVRLPLRALRRLRAAGKTAPAGKRPLVLTSDAQSEAYRRYRSLNVRLATDVFDTILAVSNRTRHVLMRRGVPAERLAVSYIGTAHHAAFLAARRIQSAGDNLHIAYLGYMRADKGFYFLLDALEQMPDQVAGRIAVTIAAPITDQWAVERLKATAHKFRAVIVHDGFTHATLDAVLADVTLGIVPPLWEDNLPQVAIELVSRGIPILTSNRGGAQEIASNSSFVFEAGSVPDLIGRIEEIADERLPLSLFWENEPRIISMARHVDELMRHYRRAPARTRLLAASD